MSEAQPKPPFPWAAVTACLSFGLGAGLVVGAVYLLAGSGWALLAASVPWLFASWLILRGLK